MYDTTVETFEHDGVPVEIHWDDDARNPYREWDNASTILSAVKDYDLGEPMPSAGERQAWYRDDPSSRVMQRWLTTFGGFVLAIPFTFQDYGSGGARTWLTTPDDDPADGFLVVSRETFEREGWDTVEEAERCARAEFESFAHYVSGEVFWYRVGGDAEDSETCGGFYGIEDVREMAKEMASDIARERKRLRSLPWMGEALRPVA